MERTPSQHIGSQKAPWKAREPSIIKGFSDGDEQVRWYMHICIDVFVDQGLVF
jgi:hypothetical protein